MRNMQKTCAAAALMTLLFCSVAASAEDKTLTERMDAESRRIMMQFKNASWRLEMNFKGMGASKGDAGPASTPFKECCGPNIKRIEAAVKALDGIFSEMEECYKQAGDDTELADLSLARSDLVAFTKLLRQMSETASLEEAKARGASATRAYVVFAESSEALDDCPQP